MSNLERLALVAAGRMEQLGIETQAELARLMGKNHPKQANDILNGRHVGPKAYRALERALRWPLGHAEMLLRAQPAPTDDGPPSIKVALDRITAARELLDAAERILLDLESQEPQS